MPPKDNKFPLLLGLPNELLETLPQLASGLSYKESTLLMSRLARSNRRLRALFQPDLDKRAAKQLMEYVLEPTEDNIARAKKMYVANPRLMFIKVEDEVEEYAAGIETSINDLGVEEHVAVHRKVKGNSPYQAALGVGDKGLYDDMRSYFNKVVDIEGKPINGRKLAEKQRQEKFPDGFDYPPSHFDFNALAAAITADPVLAQNRYNPAIVKNLSDPTKKALAQFRTDFLPKEAVNCGHHFNLNHLLKAFEVYNAHYEQWNWNQRSLFWCQVIGYLERLVPAVDAQAFCQGLYYHLEQNQPLLRSFKVEHWDDVVTSYFPLPDGGAGLGFDFGIYIGPFRGQPAVRLAGPAAAPHDLKNYVEQKYQALADLSNILDREPVVQNDNKRLRVSA